MRGGAVTGVQTCALPISFMSELHINLPPAFTGAPLTVEGTHHLVRAQVCVDPATGGVAVDLVNHIAVPIADCAAKGFQLTAGIVNLPAVALVLALTTLLVVGIKESARFNNAIVYVKVAIVLL